MRRREISPRTGRQAAHWFDRGKRAPYALLTPASPAETTGGAAERRMRVGVPRLPLGLFARDQLLPAAQSLGPDHDVTLMIRRSLGATLGNDPERTRDELRLN